MLCLGVLSRNHKSLLRSHLGNFCRRLSWASLKLNSPVTDVVHTHLSPTTLRTGMFICSIKAHRCLVSALTLRGRFQEPSKMKFKTVACGLPRDCSVFHPSLLIRGPLEHQGSNQKLIFDQVPTLYRMKGMRPALICSISFQTREFT